MSAKVPGRSERRGWHLRGASSPARPVALDATSARGLLALLDGRDDEAAVSARAQLVAALGSGTTEAIRAAMEAARAAVANTNEPPSAA